MVSVLASIAVDRGFEPQSGQTKDYNNGICCFENKLIFNEMMMRSALFLSQVGNTLSSIL
jgi:hypothetical protein